MKVLAKVTVASLLGATMAVGAAVSAPYYKDKDLNVVINYSAGGPTDIEGRLFARHLGKHLEGNPNVRANNMAGAGGAVGANYLGTAAPKDGTTIGYLSGAGWRAVFNPDEWTAPFADYEVVAYQPGTSMHYVRSDVEPGIKGPSDLPKARGMVAGGLRATQSKDITMRLVLDMLGVDYDYVTGYKGTSKARTALQQGEIHYLVESAPSYRGVVVPTMVKEGLVTPLFFDPGIRPNGEYYTPAPAQGLEDMQPFHVVYEQIKGERPSGELWEAYKAITNISRGLQRLIVLPPGAPEEAAAELREAIAKLNKDEEFAKDAMRTFGFVPQYETSAQVDEEVQSMLHLKPELKGFIDKYTAQGAD
jgi:tripartite-type tricarboxylate transporter receptor subunit TctC